MSRWWIHLGVQLPAARALVALDTVQSDGAQVTLDQGLSSGGVITVYGAVIGDTVRAVTLDGASAGAIEIEDRVDHRMTLRPVSGALRQVVGSTPHPYVEIVPDYGEIRQ